MEDPLDILVSRCSVRRGLDGYGEVVFHTRFFPLVFFIRDFIEDADDSPLPSVVTRILASKVNWLTSYRSPNDIFQWYERDQ